MLLYFGVILFLIGNFTGLEIDVFNSIKLLWISLALTCLLVAVLWRRKEVLNICVCLVFLCLGIFNGSRVGISAEDELKPYFGQQITVQGRIDAASIKEQSNGYSLILNCQQLAVENKAIEYDGSLRLFIDKKQLSLEKQPLGVVVINGKLEHMTYFSNPGSFDGRLWNRIHHIGGRLQKARLIIMKEEIRLMDEAALLNKELRAKFAEQLKPEAASLLGGMVLGGAGLEEETRDIFAINGMAHILSVSGAHLVLLSSLLSIVLHPISGRWRKPLILLLLLCYGALCGFKPPVLRALCMSAVTLYGGSGGERGLLLGFTAVALLLFEPLWLLDLGFQLSFLAVAGIIWLQPKCKQLLNKMLPEYLSEILAITMAAQLAVLPLEIANFHQVSVISMISNLLLVPVLELCVLLAIVGLGLSALPFYHFALEQYLFVVTDFLVKQIMVQAAWLANLPFSTVVIGSMSINTDFGFQSANHSGLFASMTSCIYNAWSIFIKDGIALACCAIYYVWVLVWADVPFSLYLSNRQRSYILLICSCTLAMALFWSRFAPQPLAVFFLDVGQGDCAVVVTPNSFSEKRKIIVFDTGGLKNYSTGSKILAPFLRTLGSKEIDVLVLSHYDFDHVGGANGLARVCNAKLVILPKEVMTNESEKLILTMAKHWRGCNFVAAEKGMKYSFNNDDGKITSTSKPSTFGNALAMAKNEAVKQSDADNLLDVGICVDDRKKDHNTEKYNDGVLLKIIDVPDRLTKGNEASTVAEISYKKYKLLFTGDLDEKREELLNRLDRYDVLKAGHHGSRYSSSDFFLNQVRPQITVISCGLNNRFGHPHQEALERFAFYGSKVLRTDKSGCIKLVFDDEIRAYGYEGGLWCGL